MQISEVFRGKADQEASSSSGSGRGAGVDPFLEARRTYPGEGEQHYMRQGAHLIASDLRKERGAQGVLGAGVPGSPHGLAPGQGGPCSREGEEG